MDTLIPPVLRYCVFGYLEDLFIVSEDFSSHLAVLVRIAYPFKKTNLTLIAKSHFCVKKVNYLGYVIGSGGITTGPSKVSCTVNWLTPKNLKQVRGFLFVGGIVDLLKIIQTLRSQLPRCGPPRKHLSGPRPPK